MRHFWAVIWVGLAVQLGAGGCTWIDRHAAADNHALLDKAMPSPDSVGLEIFFAKAAHKDQALNGALWNEIDEQRLPAELRAKLQENGFRAGIVGGHVPDELARLLTLTDKPQPKNDEPQPMQFEREPAVTMRLLQARAHKRNEVVCSQIYDSLPLLRKEDGQLRGQTFSQAEGRFALKLIPEVANRVALDLIPEVHYGDQQPRWVGTDGMLRLEAGRPRQVFEDLRMRVSLAPGEMLIMTSLADQSGSLGHYFFTQSSSEGLGQKLLVIRLAQSGADKAVTADDVELAAINADLKVK